MKKITPFLWFEKDLEEAMNFYVSVFKNSKIISVRTFGAGPDEVVTGTMEIMGQEFMLLQGGPHFKLTEAFSFFVDCETQAEVDDLWNKLTANGGQESMCGWLKDKYGLSWQIIPSVLLRLMGDKNKSKAKSVTEAMLKMRKLNIQALQDAYDKG